MNGINVLQLIALVVETPEVKGSPFTITKLPKILGTCFAFRRSTCFLTAAHVVKLCTNREDLGIAFIGGGGLRPVQTVYVHPTADIAVLEAIDTKTVAIEPATNIVTGIHLGEPFAAFGFPATLILDESGSGGTMHRTLFGYYQRFMSYESPMGYRYYAGEMNVSVLVGMSGAPVVNPTSYLVSGLAVESIDVESLPAIIAETRRGGVLVERYSEKYMTRYGIAVILERVLDWINGHIPPH